ncbi:MAG: transposase [Bdellovibrionales bacterium]|nr:transposase [Bdellovibrionales bacterium]
MKQDKGRRAFSSEFKKEVLAKIAKGEKISEVAKQNGITVQTIYGWKRQMRDQELDAAVDKAPRVKQTGVDPKYVRSLEEKLRESNEKLGQLFLIVEDLKKTPLGSMKNASSYIVTGKPWDQLKRRAR